MGKGIGPTDTWRNCVTHCERIMGEAFEEERRSLVSPMKLIVSLMDSSEESEIDKSFLRQAAKEQDEIVRKDSDY
jgi:hypothetical protein